MFGVDLHIENVCADCPLRDIINPETARIVASATGLSFLDKNGSTVSNIYRDAEGKHATVIVAQPAVVKRDEYGQVELYGDSDIDLEMTRKAGQTIENCEGPKRQGLLHKKHCLGGIAFRGVNQIEKQILRQVRPAGVKFRPATSIKSDSREQ